MSEEVSLAKVKKGEIAVVKSLHGGDQSVRRLEAMGIRIGKQIKKISGLAWGPITVRVGHTHVGLGRGLAEKVIVEIVK